MKTKTSLKRRAVRSFDFEISPTPARSMTIANLIADQVRDALFQDRLKAGDFVGTEQEVADKFHVSRIAARDALRTLEASGVVTVRPGPGGGARIAHGNPLRFAEALAIQLKLVAVSEYEIYVAQQAIDAMAVEHAARNADDDEIRGLEELIREAEALRSDIPAFKKSCLDFHAAVTEASHNRVLIALRSSIDKVLLDAYQGTPSPKHVSIILNHHREIVKRIKARDGRQAGEQMRKHLAEMAIWPDRQPAAARKSKAKSGSARAKAPRRKRNSK